MNAKQLKFANEYLKGSSATQAAIRAGYSKNNADVTGPKMLGNVGIKKYIEEYQEKQAAKTEMTVDRLRDEFIKLATFDIRRLYKPDGTLIPIHELDDATAAAISSVEVIEEVYRNKARGVTKKLKTFDKIRAMEGLGKIIGAFKADNEQSASVVNMPLDLSHLSLAQLKELKYGKANT